MTYVMSDIHGCLDKYQAMLQKIEFSSNDTLYVLGDVIDRGPAGFQIMLDMARHPNMVGLLGNHEAMAQDALHAILQTNYIDSDWEQLDEVQLWFQNGGELSLADLLWMDNSQFQTVLEYLLAMPLYKEIEVAGKKFVLVHGGLKHFSPERPLPDYTRDEIVWCRPKKSTTYFLDKFLVHGHTPVQLLFGGRKWRSTPSQPKFYRAKTFIDIDCGCVFPGGRLGCLCLDTMEEIYI